MYGATLGLLGFGTIAQELARRAQAFGCDLVIWARRFADDPARDLTPYGSSRKRAGSRVTIAPSAEAVAEQADILSVHLALTPETRGLVGADLLGRLRPGALFINTARAEVVDQAALADAVRERGIRVGLDVYATSRPPGPAEFEDPLVALPGVYGTHHIGASTEQAQEAIAAETVRIVGSFAETGRVPNVVNLARRTPATHMLVVRHRDRPGVLAHVFEQLARRASTSRRRRTSCSRARRPRSRGSTSIARRRRRSSKRSARQREHPERPARRALGSVAPIEGKTPLPPSPPPPGVDLGLLSQAVRGWRACPARIQAHHEWIDRRPAASTTSWPTPLSLGPGTVSALGGRPRLIGGERGRRRWFARTGRAGLAFPSPDPTPPTACSTRGHSPPPPLPPGDVVANPMRDVALSDESG